MLVLSLHGRLVYTTLGPSKPPCKDFITGAMCYNNHGHKHIGKVEEDDGWCPTTGNGMSTMLLLFV
jgi:hypothetical protein